MEFKLFEKLKTPVIAFVELELVDKIDKLNPGKSQVGKGGFPPSDCSALARGVLMGSPDLWCLQDLGVGDSTV